MANQQGMAGLESFDSSLTPSNTTTRDGQLNTNVDGGDPGLSTLLGSEADSFHSDDFGQPLQPGGVGAWKLENGGVGGGGEEDGTEEYGSLLDEEEVVGGQGGGGLREEDDGLLDTQAGGKAKTAGIQATKKTATTTTTTSSSSRPTTSSKPTSSAPAPSGYTSNPTMYALAETSSISNAGAKELSSMDDDESREERYGRAAGRRASEGQVLGGKKKDGKEKGGSGGGHMTLREQEKYLTSSSPSSRQVIDEFKKENFDLKLKIHFYEARLSSLSSESVTQTIQENISLKVTYNTARTELKRHKKLLLDQDRVMENVIEERDALLDQKEEWERREKELVRQVREKESGSRRGRGREGEEMGEDARAEIAILRSELDASREAHEELLGTREELEHQLRETTDLLDEAMEDVERLKGGVGSTSLASSSGHRERAKTERREEELASLRSQVTAQVTMLSARNAEKEALQNLVEGLKQDVAQLEDDLDQRERENERKERGEGVGEEKGMEELEQENAEHRDRASSHALQIEELERQLDEKEKELEEVLQDLDNKDEDTRRALKQVEEEWRREVEDARMREDEARGVTLHHKEKENEELADRLEEVLQDLATKDAEMQADSEEVAALTEDLGKLGQQIFTLEEEGEEKDKRIEELESELSAVDKELEDKQAINEQVVNTLKEKLATTKSRLSELTIQHESLTTEGKFLRERVEDLALELASVEEKWRGDREERRRLEDEVEELVRALRKEEEERDLDQQEWNRQREDEERKWDRVFEEKERDVKSAQSELVKVRAVLATRESDLQKLQDVLNNIQSETRRLGESQSNDRFSLELELDRLKRDVKRYTEELEREKAEGDKMESTLRERDLALATVASGFSFPNWSISLRWVADVGSLQNSENKELAAQVASLTSLRLSVTEKYDQQTKALRDLQSDLSAARDRLKVVEDQLNTDHRALSRTESQYRDQLTERNTLLLTIYQYMDKMIGPEKSPRRSGSDPKPFTNFSVFHDSLIARLKSVNQVTLSFDRRTREIDTKFQEQFNTLKRQQESRLRQLDRFEGALKTATETQRQWRQRVNVKQLELEAAKGTNSELQAQIASLRQRGSSQGSPDAGTSAKLVALSSRASTAERRLAATAAQLADAEEKLAEGRAKVSVAETKWEARMREYEQRQRASDEKTKRERQGAKERVIELTEQIKNLENQVSGARRRDHQLDDVIQKHKDTIDKADSHHPGDGAVELNAARRAALAEVDNAKFGWFHVRAVMVAGVGFYTDAYDIFAINLASTMLGYVYNQGVHGGKLTSNQDLGLKVSTPVGTLFGQLGFGYLADVYGRKRMYGIELMIIIIATIGQAVAGHGPAVSIIGVLIFWRFIMGLGIGGDYPLSATITSEYAATRIRGRMMTAVFASQGWGQLSAAIVSLVVVSAFKNQIIADPANYAHHVDFCWRLLIGLGAVPGGVALYFRLTLPETPRFTMDVERNIKQASADVDAFLASGAHGEEVEVHRVNAPLATRRDFWAHFSKWENGKVLLGTAYSWFALDVAFYGLGLNSSIILQAIGYGNATTGTASFKRWQTLHNLSVGNIILSVAGLIPGYWVSFLFIDSWGRKPIQLMGFIMLTITISAMGFGFHKLKESVGAFVFLYCITNFFQNFGPNTTTFVVPGEVFPTRYRYQPAFFSRNSYSHLTSSRSTAHGISAASGKFGAIIAQVMAFELKDRGGAPGAGAWINHVLEIFALFMLTGIFSTLLIPETKNKTLEELSGEDQDNFIKVAPQASARA
ncbi:MFS transporter, PHS family, inorganic phosphate transporter, partial [Phenoliferia sp. Uapishka_3]